jgi:hypothetical protein
VELSQDAADALAQLKAALDNEAEVAGFEMQAKEGTTITAMPKIMGQTIDVPIVIPPIKIPPIMIGGMMPGPTDPT